VGTGADEEFREFMRGRWPAMVRLAHGLAGDLGPAEDIAQAAFARAYASWGRVIKAGDPDAHLRRIVISESRRRFRRGRAVQAVLGARPDSALGARPDSAVPDAGAESGEQEALLSALRQLPPRQRAVVVLRFWLEMSEADTAAALGCSVGAVQRQASRAPVSLRRASAPADFWPTDRDYLEGDIIEGGLL
jgi:RNA polymerase sigma-70 factor (sigma-E family)